MDSDDATERQLQRRIRAGDEGAFDIVFRAHYPNLVRMAESIVRDRAVGEELAQEVMLELWRRRESLELEQNFRAYLMRATRNRALNHVRHERIVQREQTLAASESRTAPAPDADMLGGELESAIAASLAALPENCREVFDMSRTQGLRYAEIAEVLDISVKTVEKRMGQALAELRKSLAPWLTAGARKNTS
ncbi:MAG TPA: RNA polymerase sigma-70 factor [Gemmatimonadaceae bacterium]